VEKVTGPIVLPVFGRGRVLDALHGDDWNSEMLVKVIDFLFGACTCQVKDGNPGLDLLFAVDWDSRVFPDSGPVSGGPGDAIESDETQLRSSNGARRWLWGAFAALAVGMLACGVWVARVRRRGTAS